MRQTKSLIYLCVFLLTLVAMGSIGVLASAPVQLGTITVYGEAELEVVPDQARVSVGVETQALDAESAVTENAQLMDAVLKAVDGFGSAVSSVSTGSYQVYTVREDDSTEYRVYNELRVSLDDLEQLGQLIDVMIAAGANRVQSVQFDVANSEDAKFQALGDAVKQARNKARVLAQASDVELADVLSIKEESGSYTPYQMADTRSLMVTKEASTEIRPENIRIHARVAVEYRITPAQGRKVQHVPQEIGESLQAMGKAISVEEVESIVLHDWSQRELKSLDQQEIATIIDSLNSSPTYHGAHVMMLAGHEGLVTLKNQAQISLTSFGSKDHVIVKAERGEEEFSYVVQSSIVGSLLLGDVN